MTRPLTVAEIEHMIESCDSALRALHNPGPMTKRIAVADMLRTKRLLLAQLNDTPKSDPYHPFVRRHRSGVEL